MNAKLLTDYTTKYIWIGGDAYTAVAVAKKVGTGAWVVYNIFRDHLGTIEYLKNGINPADEYSFDAWGIRRNASNWSYTLDANDKVLFADRGFTGHEYLPWFKLYNMNGRLYDPAVGRMLSPDINVSFPDLTQSYNRYSYALNNPLKFTDPDGNNPILAIIIWGAYFGGAQANTNGQNVWKGMLVGAASGAAGGLAGGAAAAAIGTGGFIGGAVSGFAGGFAGGFVSGAGNAWLSGQSFGQGLTAGSRTGLFAGLTSGGTGGLVSGLDAISNGANFLNGKIDEVGGDFGSNGRFLDEDIPAGQKPTKTGEIAFRKENPDYGKYGMTRDGGKRPHFGVDYSGLEGDDVYVMYDGKVIKVGKSNSYGANFVRTSSKINGQMYNVDYGHMSESLVIQGTNVSGGDLIGKMGRMGIPAGMPTHVHISVWRPSLGGTQGFVMPWWK